MDLIFNNGDKLYAKEKDVRKQGIELLAKYGCIHVNHYQKQMLDIMFNNNKKDFNIYGDDFKIEINPNNIAGNCSLFINDYNEKQIPESQINIEFTKDELDQLISLFILIKSKME